METRGGILAKLLDTDRPSVALELPPVSGNQPRMLLSSGSRGVFVNLHTKAPTEERLSWTAPPIMIRLATPFLVALTPRSVEVHDLALLTPVQAVQVSHALPVCVAE